MSDPRTADLAKIHIARKDLGLDEDTYREIIRDVGKAASGSAADLTPAGRARVLGRFRERGWQPRRRAVRQSTDWRRPRIKKITALWCALADAGVVQNRSEASMVKWCAGITRKPKLEWADSDDLNRCIEGLKDWARRERVQLDD